MKVLIEGARAAHIGNTLLKRVKDSKGSSIRVSSDAYGFKSTEWYCVNPKTGSLFVYTESKVLYTDYNAAKEAYTVESVTDTISAISFKEAEEYFLS